MNHDERQHKMTAVAIVICLYAVMCAHAAVLIEAIPRYFPEPYHTSILSGHAWIEEMLNGHPEYMKKELGVPAHVFEEFVLELRRCGVKDSKRGISVEEKAAIFLYTCAAGVSTTRVGHRIQHGKEAVSRCVICWISVGYVLISAFSADISRTFYMWFRHLFSIINGSIFQSLMILSLPESCITRNSTLTSRMPLGQSTELIFPVTYLPQTTMAFEIEKDGSRRTVWPAAH